MTLTTAKSFSLEIERIANEKGITHMEAVLDYCYKQGIEPDTRGKPYLKKSQGKD